MLSMYAKGMTTINIETHMREVYDIDISDSTISWITDKSRFPQEIEAVYPKTEVQQCMIHQIRISTKFVSYKDIRKSKFDLKQVCCACTEEGVLNEPGMFKDKWDSNYPNIYRFLHDNRAALSTYFK